MADVGSDALGGVDRRGVAQAHMPGGVVGRQGDGVGAGSALHDADRGEAAVVADVGDLRRPRPRRHQHQIPPPQPASRCALTDTELDEFALDLQQRIQLAEGPNAVLTNPSLLTTTTTAGPSADDLTAMCTAITTALETKADHAAKIAELQHIRPALTTARNDLADAARLSRTERLDVEHDLKSLTLQHNRIQGDSTTHGRRGVPHAAMPSCSPAPRTNGTASCTPPPRPAPNNQPHANHSHAVPHRRRTH